MISAGVAVALVACFLGLSWAVVAAAACPKCLRPPPASAAAASAPLLAPAAGAAGATAVSRMRFWALFVYCLQAFFQNVVWIQFSTIVPQTTAFYSVSVSAQQDLRLRLRPSSSRSLRRRTP